MPGTGVNAAVTQHGETYNKLQRPNDYHIILASVPAPCEITYPPREKDATIVVKRKRDNFHDDTEEDHVQSKKAAFATQPSRRKDGHRRDGVGGGGQGYVGPGVGAESGLRVLLPGLDGEGMSDEEGEEVEGESVNEALAYLRGVRNEAQGIPFVLAAEQVVRDKRRENGKRDEQAKEHRRILYEGGAVYAVGELSATKSEHQDKGQSGSIRETHQLCHERVLERFKKLRNTFNAIRESRRARSKKSPADQQCDTDSQDTTILCGWPHSISDYEPNTSFVLRLNNRQLFRGLQQLTELINGSDVTITPRHSRWIWALLAATEDVGTLDNGRVSFVRELGSSAGRMQIRIDHDSRVKTGPDYWESCSKEEGREQKHSGDDHNVEDTDLGRDLTAAQEKETVVLVDDDVSDSEMSMSDDEQGHPQQDQQTGKDHEFEAARQRLLEQLGDRLVQPSLPPTTNKTDSRIEFQKSSECYASRAEAEKHKIKSRESLPHLKSEENAGEPHGAVSKGSAPQVYGDLNTRVTIDMVLTVVAECYGQRDLLKLRAQ